MLCLTVFQKAFLRQQWNDWIQKDKALVVNEIYIRATQTPHEHHWKWTCLFVSIVGGETFLATRSCTVTIQIVYYLTFTVSRNRLPSDDTIRNVYTDLIDATSAHCFSSPIVLQPSINSRWHRTNGERRTQCMTIWSNVRSTLWLDPMWRSNDSTQLYSHHWMCAVIGTPHRIQS